MSCIYGPHQFGTEDQGWVAHFLIQALNNRDLNIYGDGKQVRDILFVDDLVNAMMFAHSNMYKIKGRAFNIGGGVKNTISLLELIDFMEEIHGKRPEIKFGQWRRGDQKYYVSDISEFRNASGWNPRVSAYEGIRRLNQWLIENNVFDISEIKTKEIVE
jgi:CDP-paratose 2-epimerase